MQGWALTAEQTDSQTSQEAAGHVATHRRLPAPPAPRHPRVVGAPGRQLLQPQPESKTTVAPGNQEVRGWPAVAVQGPSGPLPTFLHSRQRYRNSGLLPGVLID